MIYYTFVIITLGVICACYNIGSKCNHVYYPVVESEDKILVGYQYVCSKCGKVIEINL